MTEQPDTALPAIEIFRINPRLPLIVAAASLGMILFGTLGEFDDELGTVFAGVGLLFGLGCIPWAMHDFVTLTEYHMRVGKQTFKYRDIVAVHPGAMAKRATATMPKHSQPFLLIQTRQLDAPNIVRVAHIKGGVEGLYTRLMLRVEHARDQEAQAEPLSNTASN